MSFLAPLFLVGLAAVVGPIVFHLIRRSSRERMPFSSLMFLSPSPPRLTRRSRLEHIFLMLLRCLVLGLLALGFARPFLRKPVVAAPESKSIRQVILLLDTSASMRRQNLWSAAQSRAKEILNRLEPSDRVAIFTFDRQARSVVTFEQWASMASAERVALSSQRIGELTPSWAGTHLGLALTSAAEAFEETPAEEGLSERQLILITDFQEGSRLDGLQGYDWPRGIELAVETVKARRTTNAGLQLVIDYDESVQSTNTMGPRVRVSNSTDATREEFKIRWEGGNDTNAVEIYVPPGQSRTIAAPENAAGQTNDRLVLIGDDDDFDNTVYAVRPRTEVVNVLYFGNEAENDSSQPLYYLKRALQKTLRQEVGIVIHRADATVPPDASVSAQMLFVADSLSEQPLRVVQQSLAEGKSVLIVMKSAEIAQTIAQVAGAAGVSAEEAAGERYGMLGEIKFDHPLFAPFADPRFSDFTKIRFWKHRRLDLSRIPGARALARFDNGDSALVEAPVGKGTILVLCSGWQPADSQLALSTKFVPLLYSLLEQSGALRVQRAQFAVGDEVSLTFTNRPAAITIRKPDGATAEVPPGAKFGQTDLPGLYTVATAVPPLTMAVNLDAAESKTAPLSLDELERLGLPLKKELKKETVKRAEEQRKQLLATELESQQRLWRWFILGAFAVLILETWVAARLTRRAVAEA